DQYYRLLRKRMKFPGTNSVLREAVVWGTWNYNPRPRGFWDITHDYVIANARELRRMVPDRPRYVMIDDGYQRGRSHENAAIPQPGDAWAVSGGTSQPDGMPWFYSVLESFFPPGTPAHDPKLFSAGTRATAHGIRKAGCESAIWVA